MHDSAISQSVICPGCGAQHAARLLTCPACHRLTHAQRLNELAERARTCEAANQPSEALQHWRQALELLPSGTRQHQIIAAKVQALGQQVDGVVAAPPRQSSGVAKGAAAAGGLALLLWKFKFIVVFLLTKAKFLLVGLSKGSTFFSMILSFGVYWTAFGWPLALGLVLSIYIHEMGHVAALRRFGFRATAPMFIPGFGALIRLKQVPLDAREDARIGLAGPVWGMFAAAAAYALGLALKQPMLFAVARVGAWINLFNLLPFWQLDGSRGFRALSRAHAWLVLALVAAMWFATSEGLLILIALVGAFRALSIAPATRSDRFTLGQFAVLIVALSLMSRIVVPGYPHP